MCRLSSAGDPCGDGNSTGASVVPQTPNQASRPQQEEDEIAEAKRDVSVEEGGRGGEYFVQKCRRGEGWQRWEGVLLGLCI